MVRAMRRAILLLCLALACGKSGPSTLRVSMIPTTDPGKARREMQPLADYLTKKASVPVQITVPTNYAAVVDALVNDQVYIGHLGGFTYVQASKRSAVKSPAHRQPD